MDNEIASLSPLPPTAAALPGMIALLKEAWALYTNKFKTLIAIEIIPAIIFIISGLITGAGSLTGDLSSDQGPGVALITLGVILILAAIVVAVWGEVALLLVIKNEDENLTVKQAYRRASVLFGSFFWISILAGVIVTVGFILLIVPGILFLIWYGLAQYVFIDEGDRGMKALRKSKAYVQGYWWPVAGRMAFLVLVAVAISMLVGLVSSAIPQPQVGAIIDNLASFVISPLFVAYGYLVYKHLKRIKGPVAVAQ